MLELKNYEAVRNSPENILCNTIRNMPEDEFFNPQEVHDRLPEAIQSEISVQTVRNKCREWSSR